MEIHSVNPRINRPFVKRWNPVYKRVEDDEDEYKRILESVQKELKATGSISKETFTKIVDWKASRLLGNKGWIGRHLIEGHYQEYYARKISAAKKTPDKEKIFALKAPGVDAPVASTLLHFMYPLKFPIIDVRTVEVLNHMGYINWSTRSMQNYWPFRKIMLDLSKQTGYSLRLVDTAMFAYHKTKLKL